MQVTCLVKRWDHHTTSGGYDRLGTEVGAHIVKRQRMSGVIGRVGQMIIREQSNTRAYLFDYQFGDWLAEMRVLAAGLSCPPDVIHVLYGDEQFDQLLRWRRLLRCPLVVTFHQPGHRVAPRFEIFQKGLAKGIDAAVVVATSQIEPFESWIGSNKVVYIPHGIDTARFSPGDRNFDRSRTRILMVGDHLRDWNAMHQVIDEVNCLRLGVEFHVVTSKENFAYLTGCANTVFHTQISEAELIELYREADALFVPVIEATANNAVLEALACGTPVISNTVGGIPDYVNEKCGWLFPQGEVPRVVELIQRLRTEKDFAEPYRREARMHALKFDWRHVAKQVSAVYSAVGTGRSPSDAMRDFAQAGQNGPVHAQV
jgi:glycosyltransferase involved in cell wall biosynthesis